MSSPGTRYVEVPAAALLERLEAFGRKVEGAGGRYVPPQRAKGGRELVVDLVPPGARAMVRIFTSVAEGAAVARGCGEDAIRVVVGAELPEGFRPLEEGEKILRTAPKAGDRLEAFLERLREHLQDAYRRAKAARSCPSCGSLMALRETRQKYPVVVKGKRVMRHRKFLGCLRYPRCETTLPHQEAS